LERSEQTKEQGGIAASALGTIRGHMHTNPDIDTAQTQTSLGLLNKLVIIPYELSLFEDEVNTSCVFVCAIEHVLVLNIGVRQSRARKQSCACGAEQ
jgi:hypothetical protein